MQQIPRDAGLETWDAPPPELPVGGPFAVFTPPGRRFERRSASVRWGTYSQSLALFTWITMTAPPEEVSMIGNELDDVVETITTALDGSIQFGGEAANVQSPQWSDATLVEYPERSGRLYLMMQAEIEIVIIKENAGIAA